MATTRAQQIGIWIIAVIMTVGTIGSFVIIILANDNQKIDAAKQQEQAAEQQKLYDEYQKKVDAQAKELSDKYYAEFNSYANRVGTFDAASVTELKTQDLKTGDGDTLTAESTFTAYYIGWTPDGKIFDSSIKDGALVAPITAAPGYVIEGWTEGAVGMKVGGIRILTIPSEKAYGTTGSGDTIAPNTPLKFLMMVIPTPEEIPFSTS